MHKSLVKPSLSKIARAAMRLARRVIARIRQAPPFRTLSSKYPIENLEESLAEGIVSGHPDMPIFVFDPHDVEAIIQYLQSVQIKQP